MSNLIQFNNSVKKGEIYVSSRIPLFFQYLRTTIMRVQTANPSLGLLRKDKYPVTTVLFVRSSLCTIV